MSLRLANGELPSSIKAGNTTIKRVYRGDTNVWGDWSPSSVTTKVWYDAADSNTITHNSNVVTQWSDKSGNNLHSAPDTGNTGPDTNSLTQNGLNVMDFSGDCMENHSFTHDVSGDPLYIALVIKFDESITGQYFFWAGTDSGTTRTAMRKRAEGGNEMIEVFGKNSSAAPIFVQWGTSGAGRTIDKTIYNIYVAKIHETDGATRLNGALTDTGSTGVNDLNAFILGEAESENQRFTGQIGEVVAWTDNSLITKMEGYLAHKWGLTGNLPSNHDYKTLWPTT